MLNALCLREIFSQRISFLLPPTQLSLLLALDKGKTEKKRKEGRDGQICRKRKGKKNHFSLLESKYGNQTIYSTSNIWEGILSCLL